MTSCGPTSTASSWASQSHFPVSFALSSFASGRHQHGSEHPRSRSRHKLTLPLSSLPGPLLLPWCYPSAPGSSSDGPSFSTLGRCPSPAYLALCTPLRPLPLHGACASHVPLLLPCRHGAISSPRQRSDCKKGGSRFGPCVCVCVCVCGRSRKGKEDKERASIHHVQEGKLGTRSH